MLSPQFAQAVGLVREDARIAICRSGAGSAQGFLAYHKRPSAFARPIGAPLSDLQALVSAPQAAVDASALFGAAGVRAFKINGLIDPYGLLTRGYETQGASRRIVLNDQASDFLDQMRARTPNGAKNFKRYSRRLAHDVGELRLVAPDRRSASLAQLLAWKSAQLRQTGLHDFLAVQWIQNLLQRLFATSQDGFGGLFMALYAGERLVAGQFGVRLGAHFHPWIAAMDPDLKAYSPGSLFQWMAIEAMPRLGLNIYELGAQGDHWKNMFALDALPIRAGTITGAAGRLTTAGERMYEQPAQKMESLARLRRRLDHIAASELTLTGRTRGVIDALIGLERRNAARNPG